MNQRQKSRKFLLTKILLFFVLSGVVIFLALLSYLQSQKMDITQMSFKDLKETLFKPKSLEEKTVIEREYAFISENNPQFEVFGKELIEASSLGIRVMDWSLNEKEFIGIQMQNPSIQVAGNYMAVGDLGGRRLVLYRGKVQKYNKMMEKPIMAYHLDEYGNLFVQFQSNEYRTEMQAMQDDGEVLFKRGLVEAHVLFGRFFDGGQKLLLNTLSLPQSKMKTTLEVVDRFGETHKVVPLNAPILGWVKRLKSGELILVSSLKLEAMNTTLQRLWTVDLEGELSAVSLWRGDRVVVAQSPLEQNKKLIAQKTRLDLIRQGVSTALLELDEKVIEIQTTGKLLGLQSAKNIYFSDAKGSLQAKYVNEKDIVRFRFLNTTKFFVVDDTRLCVVNIR